MTTDYEFLVPTSCICMYKNIRVGLCRLCPPPPVAVGPCALHTLHTLLLRHCLSQTLNLMQYVLILEVYAADGGCARSRRSMVATPMP